MELSTSSVLQGLTAYGTLEEIEAAVKKAMKEKRAARAKEIDEAFKEIRVAQDKYNDLVKKFIKDYGSYHSTYTSSDDMPDVFELLKPFWCI